MSKDIQSPALLGNDLLVHEVVVPWDGEVGKAYEVYLTVKAEVGKHPGFKWSEVTFDRGLGGRPVAVRVRLVERLHPFTGKDGEIHPLCTSGRVPGWFGLRFLDEAERWAVVSADKKEKNPTPEATFGV